MILNIVYGYNIEREERDPLVDVIEKAIEHFGKAIEPGAWLVDIFPFRKHSFCRSTILQQTSTDSRKSKTCRIVSFLPFPQVIRISQPADPIQITKFDTRCKKLKC